MRVIERITDPADPRVAIYRGLGEPNLVRSQRLFIAEGRFVVRRVIEHGGYRVRSLLLNEAALRDLGPHIDRLDPAVPCYVCGTADFHGITGYNIHRGCLAIVERPSPRSTAEVVAGAATVVALEGVANPDNVGGVFRIAAAFGSSVILSPTCSDPFYRKAIRTSMGAVLAVPFARADAWPGVLTEIRDAGFSIVALTPREPAVSMAEWQVGRARVALVIGTEGAGLSADAESAADVRVRIRIAEAVDSLNLAVAAGIALFAVSRSRFPVPGSRF